MPRNIKPPKPRKQKGAPPIQVEEEIPQEETVALVPSEEMPLVNEEGKALALRPNQHTYLRALSEGKSQKEARAEAGGISRQAVHLWMKEPDYTMAYNHLFGVGIIETHRNELIQAAAETTDLYQEALKAKKPLVVNYVCSSCGTKGSKEVTISDWASRLRAAEKLDQIAGVLKETREITGSVNVVEWDAADRIAFFQWQSGMVIPEQARERLKRLGVPLDAPNQ